MENAELGPSEACSNRTTDVSNAVMHRLEGALALAWTIAASPGSGEPRAIDRESDHAIASPVASLFRLPAASEQAGLPIPGDAGHAPSDASEERPHETEPLLPTYDPEWAEVPEPTRWSSFLPIWGDAAREQGYELPLPFGVSVNGLHAKRDIDVESISLRIGDGPKQSVDRFLQVDADSTVDVVIGRVDAWILPFLNVYGYGGWQHNESDLKFRVTLPTPPPLPDLEFTIDEDGALEGPVYGGGVALAGGYESLFVTGTADFAFAEFDEFDSRFEGRVYGLRSGWQGEVRSAAVRLWTGFNYFDTRVTIKGRANVPSVGPVRFEVTQGPEHPWNALVGASVGLADRFDLMLEYGFNFDDVLILTAGATVRF